MGRKIQCIGRYAMEGQTLGKGNFARVELATHSVTGCKVAIKIIDTRKLKEEYLKQNLHREARILAQLRHPNIIRLYETLKATTLYCLVLEYAGGGELLAYIKTHKDYRLSEDKSRPYVRQLVSAIHYLHERGVAHRDLKMENIMLDEKKKNVKLVDFGLSNTFSRDELMKTHCGSPEYAAPELFATGEKYGPEVDIWSLGIIMYAMMVGKLPFTTPYTDQYRRTKLLQQIEKGLVEEHVKEMTQYHLTPDCQDLLMKIIEPKPEIRLPLLDIEIHTWITQGSKMPFYPFTGHPRDKAMKTQVIEELAESLSMKKEAIEKSVHENKADETSAMYNMMLDKKRLDQGMFDMDHTSTLVPRNEARVRKKRSKSAQPTGKDKGKGKAVPPALVLPEGVDAGEGAPHTATGEPETKFSSFDFLALCSTPTWLGPERRRSRRRSRSPGCLSPHSGSMKNKRRSSRKSSPRQETADKANAEGNLSPTAAEKKDDAEAGKVGEAAGGVELTSILKEPKSSTGGSPPMKRTGSVRFSTRRRSRSCGSQRSRKGSAGSGPSRANSIHLDSEEANGACKSPTSKSPPSKSPTSKSPPLTKELAKQNPIPRPANLILKECYSQQTPVRTIERLPPPKTTVNLGGNNGPLTNVEVHFSDSSNPCSSTDLLRVPGEQPGPQAMSRLEIPSFNDPGLGADPRQLLQVRSKTRGDGRVPRANPERVSSSDSIGEPLGSAAAAAARPSCSQNLLDPSHLSVFHEGAVPRNYLTVSNALERHGSPSGAVAMQIEVCGNISHSSDTDAGGCSPDLDAPLSRLGAGDRGADSGELARDLASLRLLDHHSGAGSSREECEDRVDSMAHLISGSSYRPHPQPPLALACPSPPTRPIPPCKPPRHNIPSSSTLSKPPEPCSAARLDEIEVIERLVESSAAAPVNKGADFQRQDSSGRSSLRSQKLSSKLKTPQTPTWMLLRTPLARIESFHSDDFEFYTSGDGDRPDKGSLSSASPNSANTPTVPCFAYRLNLGKKKPPKVKGKLRGDTDSKNANATTLNSKSYHSESGHSRVEPTVTDPLLSSGSDCEHHEDCGDRLGVGTGHAKIHPMELEDADLDVGGTKGSGMSRPMANHSNAVTKQPNQVQNSVNKSSKNLQQRSEGKKKGGSKSSPWKKSLSQFLRRKRPCSRLPTNNNNNDCAPANQTQSAHNGHAPNSPSNKADNLPLPDEWLNSVDSENVWNLSPAPVPNNVSEAIELQLAPLPPRSPSPTSRVFDFTLANDSPKRKSCLLSWRGCPHCGIGDESSSEESEFDIPLDQVIHEGGKSGPDANNLQNLTGYQTSQT